jgi:hypothetical protein
MPEPIFMKLGMYIVEPERVSEAYFINPSHQSVYQPIVARKRFDKISLSLLGNGSAKLYRGNEYTRKDRRIIGRVFSMQIVSYQGKIGD